MVTAAQEDHADVTISRVVIRCPADHDKDGGRLAQIVVGDKAIEFFKVAPRASGGSAKNRTGGVFASMQPPTWQAYALLLWLVDRRERSCEHDELPLAQAQRLLGWDVKTKASLGERLKTVIGDSKVLVYQGRHAWIRSGVTVEIAPAEDREAILRWAGVSSRNRADAPEPAPVATPAGAPAEVPVAKLAALKARIAEALRRAPELARAVAKRVGLEVGADELAPGLVDKLAKMPAKEVVTIFADLTGPLIRDREVARSVLWEILPLAGDWAKVVEGARAAVGGDGSRPSPLVLPLRMETVAEIVLARLETRCCLWASGDHYPQGARHVPLPAAARAPLFDPQGKRLAEAAQEVFKHLHGAGAAADGRAFRDDFWGPVRKRWASPSAFKAAVLAEMKRTPRREEPFYMLVIDEDLDPENTRDRDQSWRIVQDAIGGALPNLRLVRLTGGDLEMESEIDLALVIGDIRDSL